MFTKNSPRPRTTSPGLRRSPRPAREQGFTLLEIIMALTLLALLSGMVFGIVRVSVRTAVDTRQMQQENDEVNRYVALCRHMFQNLPVTAILTLKLTESGIPPMQELTVSGAPEAFSYGVSPMSYKDTVIGLRPDYAATETSEKGERVYFLGITREDIIPTPVGQTAGATRASGDGLAAPDDQGRSWMPLLTNVISMHWRFYKADGDTWEEEWEDTDLPPLVEMTLLLKDRTLPLRSVFALPTTKLTEANAALRPTSTSSGTNTQGGNNNGGGGNNQGGAQQGGQRGGDGGGRSGRGGGQGQGQGQGQGGGRGQGGQGEGQGQGQGGRGGGNAGGGSRGGGSSGNSSGGAQPGGGGGGSNGGGR